jgi:predicted DNA-binding protein YlxM (UPF0122 family)
MAYMIFKFVAGIMERIVEQNLLYDFYGELLNDHQKKIYEDAIYNDLSLSEPMNMVYQDREYMI